MHIGRLGRVEHDLEIFEAFQIAWLPEFDDDVLFATAVHVRPRYASWHRQHLSGHAYMIVSVRCGSRW